MLEDPLSLLSISIWLMAVGMYPVGFLLGSCSACCEGECSECNYQRHTAGDPGRIQITAGSFTLTHPEFGSSLSATLIPDKITRTEISEPRVLFSPDSDIKEYFMDGCLADYVQEYINNGLTREEYKLDLDIGVQRLNRGFIQYDPNSTPAAEACETYRFAAEIIVSLRHVDSQLLGVISQNTPLGVCPNADTVTVTLDTKDDVFVDYFAGLEVCEQQLLDFCQALTISGSFTHTGCHCGPCCSYAEEDGRLIDCEENIAEGACQDFDFKYFPEAEDCETAECPDYREFL